MSESLTIAAPADFHVHLRQGDYAAFLAPHVRKGGFKLAYVMVPTTCLHHLDI